MARNHGARQQKKAAKHKARRADKRSSLTRRSSNDPTVRLEGASKLPVAQALCGADLWKDGIGYLTIARQETESGLIYGVFLLDVYCLGVKNAFWSAGPPGEFKDLLEKLEQTQTMVPITPESLVKIVTGAVEYAGSFGFPPHTDYRHAARLFEGIDPSACPLEFTFGRDGKPYYFKGPHETHAQAEAIAQRVAAAGGHFTIALGPFDPDDLEEFEDEWDATDADDEIGSFDEWR
jgi:hypothetical protein